MALLLIWAARRRLFPTQLVKLYMIAYLSYRFVTEFIRPEPQVLFGMTFYQCSALVFIALFAFLYWRDARSLARQGAGTASPTRQIAPSA